MSPPGAIILVDEPGSEWVAELERLLAARRYRIGRVRDLSMVPFLLLSSGINALLLDGRRLGHRETTLLQKCRRLAPAMKVVVVASSAQADLKRALDSGATSFLAWPAPAEVVLDALGPGAT